MNRLAASSILFVAEFDLQGRLTDYSRRTYEDCLRAASLWKARVRVVHILPKSQRVWWNPDYSNVAEQRRLRLTTYTLSGMLQSALELEVEAESLTLFGDKGSVVGRQLCSGEVESLWSDLSSASQLPVPAFC